MGYQHKSFVYSGLWYSEDSDPGPRIKNVLSPELTESFKQARNEILSVSELEVPYVKGCITAALNLSNSFPDYVRTLPDALAPKIKEYAFSFHAQGILTQEQVDTFKSNHAHSLNLLRQRLVRNLLV